MALKSVSPIGGVVDIGTSTSELAGQFGLGVTAFDTALRKL